MESNVRASHWVGYFFRLASIGTVSLSILLNCIANNGYSAPSVSGEILTQALLGNEAALIEKFDEIEASFRVSKNVLAEGRKFLDAFIDELNIRYHLHLTMSEACRLVRENLHSFEISSDIANSIASVIQQLDADSSQDEIPRHQEKSFHSRHWHFYPPWEWNWFGLNEKDKKCHRERTPTMHQLAQNTAPAVDLPDELVIGGVEAFAGLLLCIIPHPVTWGIGGAMVVDGIRRGLDGARGGTCDLPKGPS